MYYAKERVFCMKENKFKAFLKRKDIEISAKRYGIEALGAMAQGLFASLLIGTIINTIGTITGVELFNTIGAFATAVAGPAMAIAIGHALKAPPLVLFSLAAVGWAANAQGGAGGPLAVLIIAIISAEVGKMVSKETKVDIIVTPAVTIFAGALLSLGIAPYIGWAANKVGDFIMITTEWHPFVMGIVVSVIIGICLTLPISSAAICAAFGLVGLAGLVVYPGTSREVDLAGPVAQAGGRTLGVATAAGLDVVVLRGIEDRGDEDVASEEVLVLDHPCDGIVRIFDEHGADHRKTGLGALLCLLDHVRHELVLELGRCAVVVSELLVVEPRLGRRGSVAAGVRTQEAEGQPAAVEILGSGLHETTDVVAPERES